MSSSASSLPLGSTLVITNDQLNQSRVSGVLVRVATDAPTAYGRAALPRQETYWRSRSSCTEAFSLSSLSRLRRYRRAAREEAGQRAQPTSAMCEANASKV
ncbi:hypothetical protein PSPO01_12095 [Paraphaeosphaeria sporulosa]